jgi:hypothetical protein
MPYPSSQAIGLEFERIFLRLPRDERENLQSAIDERLAPILSQRLGNDQDFVDYLRERGVDLEGRGVVALVGIHHTTPGGINATSTRFDELLPGQTNVIWLSPMSLEETRPLALLTMDRPEAFVTMRTNHVETVEQVTGPAKVGNDPTLVIPASPKP